MDVVAIAREYLRRAGEYALENQSALEVSFKQEDRENVLTNVDLANSRLAHELLAPCLAAGDILIDEEKLPDMLPKEVLAHKGRIWVIDPIDGTKPYSEGTPYWGVMLTLYDNGKPVFAGINIPALGKMLEIMPDGVFVDGKRVEKPSADGHSIVNVSRRAVDFLPVIEAAGLTNIRVFSAALMTYNLATGESLLLAIPTKASFWDVAPLLMLAEQWDLVVFYQNMPRQNLTLTASMFEDDWHLRDILAVTSHDVYERLYDRGLRAV